MADSIERCVRDMREAARVEGPTGMRDTLLTVAGRLGAASAAAMAATVPAESSFEDRLATAQRQIQRDRENPPPIVLEGTDEFAERQRLQHYDDPLAATKEGDTHADT